MRVFQVGNLYPAHHEHLRARLETMLTYDDAHGLLVADVPHAQLLEPCLQQTDGSRLCFPQTDHGLRLWAREHDLPANLDSEAILLAMIEDTRAEIFYSVNASFHSRAFLERLPGSVRLKIGWLGSVNVGGGLMAYDAIVSNFPTLNARHRAQGLTVAYLTPSYETQTDPIEEGGSERPIDVLFTGTYSRHHQRRAELVERLALYAGDGGRTVALHLLNSRYTRLAEATPLGLFGPFQAVKRPRRVRQLAQPALFGHAMLRALSQAKIVVNMAVDSVGPDRGNLRCFEAASAGALMVSDRGDYPAGFEAGATHIEYDTPSEAIGAIDDLFQAPERIRQIGAAGASMVRERYSKAQQWRAFTNLVGRL